MDLHGTLTAMTMGGLAVSFIAGITSQIWKTTVEVEGKLTKRLTPAGVLSLGVSLVGLSGSVASELIRIGISNNEQLQAKTEAAQKLALLQQEISWRKDMSEMLVIAKSDIEKNLEDTIKGFQDSQARLTENLVASQPLTSLSFRWRFSSTSPVLLQAMEKGSDEIIKNSEDEQGGVPPTPYDAMDYGEALLPLISFVARVADDSGSAKSSAGNSAHSATIAVLIALDDSQNTILSFGDIAADTSWHEKSGGKSLSDGFLTNRGFRKGGSIPRANFQPTIRGASGAVNYSIQWELDPATLASAIARANAAIPSMAKLPKTLKVAIFYEADQLPFQQNNFALSYAVGLWNHDPSDSDSFDPGSALSNSIFTIEVNGFGERKYIYALKRVYRPRVLDEYDDEFETRCTILEFDAV